LRSHSSQVEGGNGNVCTAAVPVPSVFSSHTSRADGSRTVFHPVDVSRRTRATHGRRSSGSLSASRLTRAAPRRWSRGAGRDRKPRAPDDHGRRRDGTSPRSAWHAGLSRSAPATTPVDDTGRRRQGDDGRGRTRGLGVSVNGGPDIDASRLGRTHESNAADDNSARSLEHPRLCPHGEPGPSTIAQTASPGTHRTLCRAVVGASFVSGSGARHFQCAHHRHRPHDRHRPHHRHWGFTITARVTFTQGNKCAVTESDTRASGVENRRSVPVRRYCCGTNCRLP
jgi:hypothetical protein